MGRRQRTGGKQPPEVCSRASPGSRTGPGQPRELSRPGAGRHTGPGLPELHRPAAPPGGRVGCWSPAAPACEYRGSRWVKPSLVSLSCLGQHCSREGLGTAVCYLLPTPSNWSLGNTAAGRGGPIQLSTGWAQTPNCYLY